MCFYHAFIAGRLIAGHPDPYLRMIVLSIDEFSSAIALRLSERSDTVACLRSDTGTLKVTSTG